MRRLAAAALMVAALLVVSAPAASAGSVDNEYQGRVERTEGTFFGFDLAKKNGKTRVTNIGALLNYNCAGDGGGRGGAIAKGSLKVEKRKFAGKLEIDNSVRSGKRASPPGTYDITGRLGKHGKASGTIDAVIFATIVRPRGPAPTRCYSGRLHWNAKKGATVPVNRSAAARH